MALKAARFANLFLTGVLTGNEFDSWTVLHPALRELPTRPTCSYKGSATELQELLGTPAWPGRADDLAKAVLSIAQRSPILSAERKKSGSGRYWVLSLKNGVLGVPGVPSGPEHPERDVGLDELAELVRNQESPW